MAFLTVAATAALLTSGCAGPEQKLGRGVNNMYEVVRMGEMRRSIEQTAIFESPETGYTFGAIRGVDRTLQRTGLGIWQTVTFWTPVFTKHDPVSSGFSRLCQLEPNPVYPESYRPRLVSDSIFDTDTYTGFSGGDVAPFIPGSRFSVYNN